MFYEEVLTKLRVWLEEHLAEEAHGFETVGLFPRTIWQELLADLDLLQLLLDEELDRGLPTFLEALRLISSHSPSLAAALSVQGIFGLVPFHRFGGAANQELVPSLLTGEVLVSFAFSEEGRDLSRKLPLTLAEQTEEGWLLSGHKYMVSNAALAQVFLVLARTRLLTGAEGTGIFIVPADSPGLVIGKELKKSGLKALPLSPVSLTAVSLPRDSLLGGPTDGLDQFLTILRLKRLAISAQSLGIAEGVFQKGLDDSKIKRGFGKRPIDVPLNQAKFAEIEARLAACQAYYQLYIRSRMTDDRQVALLKLMTAGLAREVAEEVVRMTGAYSFVAGDDLDRFVRDAQVMALYGGSSQSLKRQIAQTWLEG